MKKYYETLMQTVAEQQRAIRKSFAATGYLSSVIVSHQEINSRFRIDDVGLEEAGVLANTLEQVIELSSESPSTIRIIAAAMLLSSVTYRDMNEVDFDDGRDDLAAVMAAACAIAETAFLKKITEAASSEDGWGDPSEIEDELDSDEEGELDGLEDDELDDNEKNEENTNEFVEDEPEVNEKEKDPKDEKFELESKLDDVTSIVDEVFNIDNTAVDKDKEHTGAIPASHE